MALYLKINGIAGNVTAKGHENWIEIFSANFHLMRAVSNISNKVTDRLHNQPQFSQISITKYCDAATNDLFQAACSGKVYESAEVDACTTDSDLTPYSKLILSNVIIANHSHDWVHGGKPLETIALSYTKLEIQYHGRDASFSQASPKISGFDVASHEVM